MFQLGLQKKLVKLVNSTEKHSIVFVFPDLPTGLVTPRKPASPRVLKTLRAGNFPCASHCSTWGLISCSMIYGAKTSAASSIKNTRQERKSEACTRTCTDTHSADVLLQVRASRDHPRGWLSHKTHRNIKLYGFISYVLQHYFDVCSQNEKPIELDGT